MVHYLIQLLVFQALFLGVYELFLKRETFFSLNRMYLLITPFLAALIPLLEFEILYNFVPASEMVQLPALFISENTSAAVIAHGEPEFYLLDFLKTNWLVILYSLGAMIRVAVFLRKYSQLQRLKCSGNTEKHEKTAIVRVPKSRMACSFFNTIFLGENLSETETSQILKHELAHVEQKHSWDLLLFEFLQVVLWFDPIIYRQQSQLSILHEYIADEKAVQQTEKKTYFQNLLNTNFGTREISFTNPFFSKSLIKKRIMMLQKPKSNRNAKLKYLLVLPLMFMMLAYVACSEDVPTNENQEMVPPAEPPTAAYKDYLEFTEYMESKGKSFDWTFEEYQKFINIAQEKTTTGETTSITEKDAVTQIPFSVIDQAPIFPGCENLTDNEAQKACTSKKVQAFVNANFDTGLAKKLGLSGANRIQVMFKINPGGEVVEVKARASHTALKEEAVRVVKMLPDMMPGKQNEKTVSVLYSLPIIFQVH